MGLEPTLPKERNFESRASARAGSLWLTLNNRRHCGGIIIVPKVGLEPTLPKERDFESRASARAGSLWLTLNNRRHCGGIIIVPKVGLEPTLPKERDFESRASANSATSAHYNCSIFNSICFLLYYTHITKIEIYHYG